MRPATLIPLGLLSLGLNSCAPLILPPAFPSPTPPSAPPALAVQTASGTESTWQFVDPRVAGIPELLVTTEQGYQVDPTWEVQAVDYVVKQWGIMQTPVFTYQHLESPPGPAGHGVREVTAAELQPLRAALQNFYPIQHPLEGERIGDDYGEPPEHWTGSDFVTRQLELVGQDGRRVLLFNTGYGPYWNLVFNGRLYAQYNAKLQAALSDLLAEEIAWGQWVALENRPVPAPTDYQRLQLGSIPWPLPNTPRPAQLLEGFGGLLPIAENFHYHVNASAQTLEITVALPLPFDDFQGLQTNVVETLDALTVTTAMHPATPCSGGQTTEDWELVTWQFTCPLLAGAPSAQNIYHLTVAGGTRHGSPLQLTGELWGPGANPATTPLFPLPETLAAALAAHPAAHDLLTDHQPLSAAYDAILQPTQAPADGLWAGTVVLAGQTTWQGQPLRYTVRTPFVLDHGELRRWDLDRPKLQALLAQILAAPLTQQVQAAKSIRALELVYAETLPPWTTPVAEALPRLGTSLSELVQYEYALLPCQALPSGIYPNATTPLQGFSYHFTLTPAGHRYFGETYPYPVQFLWVDNAPWPLRLDFGGNMADDFPLSLLPREVTGPAQRPLDLLTVDRSAHTEASAPYLWLGLPPAAEQDETQQATYAELAARLRTTVKSTGLIVAEDFILSVNAAGQFQVVDCATAN